MPRVHRAGNALRGEHWSACGTVRVTEAVPDEAVTCQSCLRTMRPPGPRLVHRYEEGVLRSLCGNGMRYFASPDATVWHKVTCSTCLDSAS